MSARDVDQIGFNIAAQLGTDSVMLPSAAEALVEEYFNAVRKHVLYEAADVIAAVVDRWEGMSDQASAVMNARHAMAERVRRMAEGDEVR